MRHLLGMATSSKLKITDLNTKVKPSLSIFYGIGPSEEAINKLVTWYTDQHFDDESFADDWIPNDFDDCDGIDRLVKALNHQTLLNKDTQVILFNWVCHWLSPHNTQEPNVKPSYPIITDDSI